MIPKAARFKTEARPANPARSSTRSHSIGSRMTTNASPSAAAVTPAGGDRLDNHSNPIIKGTLASHSSNPTS